MSLLATTPASLAPLFKSQGGGIFSVGFLFKVFQSHDWTGDKHSEQNLSFPLVFLGCYKQQRREFSAKLLTNRLAWNGPMLLKIISKHRGRSPPSPGDPVMVCVFPLPVTPYVKRRPRRDSKVTESCFLSQKKAQL